MAYLGQQVGTRDRAGDVVHVVDDDEVAEPHRAEERVRARDRRVLRGISLYRAISRRGGGGVGGG